ncbi:amino acid ABC transporter permease [Paracoccus onubensis]|uniref:amino acid ABC transporter permease n=1 Tax=Paracoccus onubensis TaxID=1675788 RepID=UPI00272F1404|nr:amino acid ABC transporter permease [Paracoccus onubensis]MDP0928681.1 amino acid ABC transporter permease [Paracoccus onubensis]
MTSDTTAWVLEGENASRGTDRPVELNQVTPRRHPGRWIAIVLLGIVVMQVAHNVIVNPNFHWNVFWQYLFAPTVIAGVGWTLVLTVVAMLVGITCAAILVLMRDSDNPILKTLSWVWIWFFRGTPLYTQLLFWGLFAVLFPRLSISVPFGPEILGVPTEWVVSAGVAAVLGLGLNESAYLAEIFRAGFKAIDRGQTEAAQAIGMSRARIWWRILLPQAMRTIIPPTGNETIGMLKGTALVLAVPFTLDLMFATSAIANRIYLPVPMLMVAAFWYLIITSVMMIGQYYLERHFGKGQDYVQTRHI